LCRRRLKRCVLKKKKLGKQLNARKTGYKERRAPEVSATERKTKKDKNRVFGERVVSEGSGGRRLD